MTWKPMERSELEAIVVKELAECSADLKQVFAQASIKPSKWRLSPWSDEFGGFWAVAVLRGRVLWYNEIEGGFNVSRYNVAGQIPESEYWCNQDTLSWALPRLMGDLGVRSGPPQPVRGAKK